jgi:hypothetical protein
MSNTTEYFGQVSSFFFQTHYTDMKQAKILLHTFQKLKMAERTGFGIDLVERN